MSQIRKRLSSIKLEKSSVLRIYSYEDITNYSETRIMAETIYIIALVLFWMMLSFLIWNAVNIFFKVYEYTYETFIKSYRCTTCNIKVRRCNSYRDLTLFCCSEECYIVHRSHYLYDYLYINHKEAFLDANVEDGLVPYGYLFINHKEEL